jgi:hypothetical protein
MLCTYNATLLWNCEEYATHDKRRGYKGEKMQRRNDHVEKCHATCNQIYIS